MRRRAARCDGRGPTRTAAGGESSYRAFRPPRTGTHTTQSVRRRARRHGACLDEEHRRPRPRSPRGGPPLHHGRAPAGGGRGASPERDHLRRAALPGASDAAAARRAARACATASADRRSSGDAVADNREYVEWLVEESMLCGRQPARDRSSPARGACGRTRSRTRTRAPRWSGRRCGSPPTRCRSSPARASRSCPALADPALWQAFRADRHRRRPHRPGQAGRRPQRLAPDAVRRRPLRPHQHAGRPGLRHRGASSARLCATAAEYDGTVIDDIVPGHTGKGADFRLAEMGYARLPGHLPHGRDRAPRTGTCCPTSPRAATPSNLDAETEAALERAGYIIGRLQRVIFYEPGVKETNWSATRRGHGRRRRRAPLGLPALLQGGPALDQLARPVASPACGW